MKSDPLNQDELKFVGDILTKYGNDESILDVSELDGFLTAIVSGPSLIVPSRWVPILWGDRGQEPEWEKEDEFQKFFPLVMQHMNNNAGILMEYPGEFEALFMQREVDGTVYRIVDEWCEGYLKGVNLDPNTWLQAPKALLDEHLSVMHIFGTDEHFEMLDQLSDNGVNALQDKVKNATREIHAYFLQQRENEVLRPITKKPSPISVLPTVGRNAPCPCGSGKKAKKCCLQ